MCGDAREEEKANSVAGWLAVDLDGIVMTCYELVKCFLSDLPISFFVVARPIFLGTGSLWGFGRAGFLESISSFLR